MVKWAQPSLIAAIQTATLPADMPTDTPGMIVATGEVTITDSINGDDSNTPELETLLIVSGCHIVIDGPCVFEALIAGDPESAPQNCDGRVLNLTDYDPNLKRRVPVSLTNVLIVAAGGLWAPELQPVVGTECSYAAPELIIQGSVITGHAGATSRLWDCDSDSVPEMIAAGYDRSSDLPDPEAWATADIAWWPERQHGVWRRQGRPVRLSVDAGSTGDPGLSVNPATVTVTEGSTARLVAVALATQPSADVTVNITQTPTAVLLVTPTLEFTEDDWDTAKYVRVDASAYQDADSIDTQITVTLTAASTDGHYDRLTEDVEVTVVDDDIPALVVDAASMTVDETGSGTFTVSLTTAPSADVTVNVASDDPTAVTVTPTPLTFTPDDWATAQTVTVTGVSDDDASDEALLVSLIAASTDSDYADMTVSVSVTVTDDDTAALVVSQNSVTVDENGTATFDVSLATQPTGSVTVSVTSADPAAVTADPDSLTFTTTDWDAAQTVTVTGTDDADTSNDTATITLTSMSADSDYDSLTAAVAVTTADDDGVDVLTVTCDAAAQTITIQWPELEADRVQISGRSGVTADWYDVTGSIVTVSTEGLADWLIQYGNGQWEPQWGEQPDDWGNGWGGFFPAGRELTVYVWPNHNSGDTFPCP